MHGIPQLPGKGPGAGLFLRVHEGDVIPQVPLRVAAQKTELGVLAVPAHPLLEQVAAPLRAVAAGQQQSQGFPRPQGGTFFGPRNTCPWPYTSRSSNAFMGGVQYQE